ncbi:CPBP family intramembrane metalloprotease [Euzebyella marina]|uniref:CPBP family intramembrane metalloprotease n=1 Tax=Euzebyella marina TaxID=1761453 RepID=A0A3G2L723_9FLAO|nr:CPBP family intramembrane glutamic endopeptidase [Euzebyella marina]AYN67981.1 CPBP family intramembrane metalloprotease [Euzebyella marina]
MSSKIIAVWEFFKNPTYEESLEKDPHERLRWFTELLLYALTLSYLIGMVNAGLQNYFDIDIGKHASEDLMNRSLLLLFAAAVIMAPVMEEVIFRGPLIFFKKKNYFNCIFYFLTFIFGFYHISNFELTTTTLLLSPLLVAPQLSVGIFLGFVRVKFGLLWAIIFHALYNFILMTPLLFMNFLDLLLE